MRFLLTIAFAITLSNCRSKPEILPNYPDKSSAIVFEMGIPQLMFGDKPTEKVWLVKLEKNSKKINDLELIQANFKSQSRFYHLNIEPGEYAFVAAYVFVKGQQMQPNQHVYYVFDRSNLEKYKFTVKPNQLQVLGKYRIEYNGTAIEQDPDMDNVGEKVVGNFKSSIALRLGVAIASALLGGDITTGGYAGVKELVNSPESKSTIEKETREDLEGTDWFKLPIAK
jgi:hypothetical protein